MANNNDGLRGDLRRNDLDIVETVVEGGEQPDGSFMPDWVVPTGKKFKIREVGEEGDTGEDQVSGGEGKK